LLASHFAIADEILEVEVTPNRPDCLSVRGMAREIAAVTGVSFDEEVSYSHPWGERTVDRDVSIEVQAPDLCPRYSARTIHGVRVQESPLWLKARIAAAGMRPINNVVDVTNYVLWALGQPLHAFDLRTIRGSRITVRRAAPGEKIITLDNQERVLSPDMLVIADAERASVIAGIMGGLESEVTGETTDILLEAANFSGPSIMRTSGTLGLRSEASTRYEKGLDPEMIPLAMDFACKLFVEVCEGEVSVGTIDVRSEPAAERVVDLRTARVRDLLGLEVDTDAMAEIVESLGCEIEEPGEAGLRVHIPSFRRDLEREIDLIEEVARVYGVDRIPSTIPARRHGRGGLTALQTARRQAEDLLVGSGLAQVITYSFGDDVWPDRLRLDVADPRRDGVKIANPLSSEQSVMRTMLLPGLLGTAKGNLSVRENRVHIFETGRVFHPGQGVLPEEKNHVGILVAGDWQEESWLCNSVDTDYFLVKGLIERLCLGLKVEICFMHGSEPFLHPGKTALLVDGEGRSLGWLGELHPLALQAFDIRSERVVAAEMDLDLLLADTGGDVLFEDLLAFPIVEQDLALVTDADVSADRVIEAVSQAAGDLLENARVFDVFEGAQVGEGKRSLALRLCFRSSERTLSEAEVNGIRERIIAAVSKNLGAQLRA
jgi:phenylalanyl-tRNA synthetase beta chain